MCSFQPIQLLDQKLIIKKNNNNKNKIHRSVKCLLIILKTKNSCRDKIYHSSNRIIVLPQKNCFIFSQLLFSNLTHLLHRF